MTLRAVYDTMVFLQWAALPEGRQHGTIRAIYSGAIRLCVSQALLNEVQDVLSRPSVKLRSPNITPERLKEVLAATLEKADLIGDVPAVYTWPHHPSDDHLFNLAIAARVDRLVTWEERILSIDSKFPEDAKLLFGLAPQLRIVSPKQLAEELRSEQP